MLAIAAVNLLFMYFSFIALQVVVVAAAIIVFIGLRNFIIMTSFYAVPEIHRSWKSQEGMNTVRRKIARELEKAMGREKFQSGRKEGRKGRRKNKKGREGGGE